MSIISQNAIVNTKKVNKSNDLLSYIKEYPGKYISVDSSGNSVNPHKFGLLSYQEFKDQSSFHYPVPNRKRVLKFRFYPSSVEIIIDNGLKPEIKLETSVRSAITKLSKESVRRCKLVLESNIDLFNFEAGVTYPSEFPLDGKIFKKHLILLKKWFHRHGVDVLFWYVEFQRRGAPHIHFYLSSGVDKISFSKFWYKVVGSGDLLHLVSGTHISVIRNREKMSSYCIGHVGKTAQKTVPKNFINVGRFWGCTNKAVVKDEVSFMYHSDEALEADMSAVVNEYDRMLNEWSKDNPDRRPFEFKERGFIFWRGSEFVKNLVDKCHFDESKYNDNPLPKKVFKSIDYKISDIPFVLQGYKLKDFKKYDVQEKNSVC